MTDRSRGESGGELGATMADAAGTSDLAIGGIIGGAVSVLTVLGGGIRWLAGWTERRADSRQRKLQVWHNELEQREKTLNAEKETHHREVERRLGEIERKHDRLQTEHVALRLAFEMVAGALRQSDPQNPTLRQAEALLSAAFPLLPEVPAEMAEHLASIDAEKGEA